MSRALFLDRDGVLTSLVFYSDTGEYESPRSRSDFALIPGALPALKRLYEQGWLLFLVSNQPSYAKGKTSLENLQAVHTLLEGSLSSSGITFQACYYCYHHPNGIVQSHTRSCDCRKPEMGSLLHAKQEFGLQLADCWMVGDQDTDMMCGQRAGCRTIQLEYVPSASKRGQSVPDWRCQDLDHAAAILTRKLQRIMTLYLAESSIDVQAEYVSLHDLHVKLFADGANLDHILKLAARPYIKGFTTNPSLMRKAGVTDYQAFARQVLEHITEYPVSFEVFSDEFAEMERQARLIASWGANVYVKIPVTNTRRELSAPLIRRLSDDGLKLNVTALMTIDHVHTVRQALNQSVPSIVSIFAGRIADSGRNPLPIMNEALDVLANLPYAELLWASTREVYNVIQADQIGCHIVTVPPDILDKLSSMGKSLDEVSAETVKMFYNDARTANYTL